MEVYVLEFKHGETWEIREMKMSKVAMEKYIRDFGGRWLDSGMEFRIVPYVADYSRVQEYVKG